jgi:acetyl-CoA carboxylase biotin carboxyl carrier protein
VDQPGGLVEAGSPSPERVADLVRSLAAVMRQSDVTELDLELGSLTLRLRRPELLAGGNGVETPVDRAATVTRPESREHLITAPMIGTFYTASAPGTSPFVSVGDEVAVGQTIGIIEAMKIMNEIAADRAGTVEAILAGNGQPVEYGSPLLRLSLGPGERS